MTTVKLYERVDNKREERGEWEVPEAFEGLVFPEELSVHQTAILDELVGTGKVEEQLAELKSDWGLSTVTPNNIIRAFVNRRDADIDPSNPQRALLRRMLMALAKSDVPEGFYIHLFTKMTTANKPQTNDAINEARSIIGQALDVGWSVEFDPNAQSEETEPVVDNVEQLAEQTF